MRGFLDEDWDPVDNVASRRRRKKSEAEDKAVVEGYDPQTPETAASTAGSLLKPVAPWEKEKAEQGTGEYWAKNILGINSLFRRDARKDHIENVSEWRTAQRALEAAQMKRDRYTGANETLVGALTNEDEADDLINVLNWQVATDQDLSYGDLSTMMPDNPLFANASGNTSSASARNIYFDAEPFIDEDGRFGYRQMTKDGSEPKVTYLPDGEYPKEWVLGPDDTSALWDKASGEYTVERSALSQAGTALEAVQAVPDKEWSAGVAGDFESFWKQKVTGNTDREQWAKKYAINIRNLQQIGLLPPGPATDRDVEIVMRGAPGDSASKEAWVQYLTSVQNLRRVSSMVADSKLQHLQTNQGKMFGMQGWRPDIEAIENTVYGARVPAQPAGEANAFTDGEPNLQDPRFLEWKKQNGYD